MLERFLGRKYKVIASMGHLIDLPKSTMGIDIENDFTPKYIVIRKRGSVMKTLRQAAKQASELWLATDPDREGEAISWHLRGALGEDKEVRRAVFHEITPHAIEEAFKNPHTLDMNKVNAQQARRVLDRLVGYNLSPLLWKKITRGLSAGRVQSVTLRLIVEREREIRAFVPKEYWSIEAELSPKDSKKERFTAGLVRVEENEPDIKTETQAGDLVERLKKASWVVSKVSEGKRRRNPSAPFTTSTLQQESYNKLRYSASRTMRLAQQLYEGVELGKEGAEGLITYMRTDSVRLSLEAEKQIRSFIEREYGSEYLTEKPKRYRSKKRAQEAHEAIRPTDMHQTPEHVKQYLTPDQLKLYRLIWARAIASQMNPAVYSVTTLEMTAEKCLFRAVGSRLVFDGFTKVYDITSKKSDDQEATQTLPHLAVGDHLNLLELIPAQHFTKPPPRFSDASLVKTLEENGIGRPSTYAPIIRTLVDRHYVERRAAALTPTELGETVNDLLVEHFPKILDVEFTARMEEELDAVEEGQVEWHKCVHEFYGPFEKTVEVANEKMGDARLEMKETGEDCPKCGKGLVIRWGRNGKFISCPGFPDCRYARSITTGVKCPKDGCDGELVKRRSKRGAFYGCTNYPTCRQVQRDLEKPDAEEKEETSEA